MAAEANPWDDWTDLQKAIEDFWTYFVPDEVYLKLYCSVLRDERFRVGFLDKFVEKFAAEARDWTIDGDPELEIPMRLMKPLFQAEKKELKKRSRERAGKLKKKETETQAEEISPDEIHLNRERMRATSKVQRNYGAYKEMKTEKQRDSRRVAKAKATLDILEKRFRLN